MWGDPKDRKEEASSEEEEDEEEDESSEDEVSDGPSSAAPGKEKEMTREQRRAAAKAKKLAAIARKEKKAAAPGDMPSSESESEEDDDEDDDDDMPRNPNHTAKSRSQASKVPQPQSPSEKKPSSKKAGDPANLSRREREALKAQQAKERYEKLHFQGKTDEAKADLERLRLIREKRELDQKRKDAEREAMKEKNLLNDAEEEKRRAIVMGKGGANSAKAKRGK